MLEDGKEYACETIDVSPTGVLLKVELVARPGARVIAYIEGLGRIEGVVVRTLANGFALALSSAPRKTERLAELIEWLAQDNYDPPKERRSGPRVDLQGAFVLLTTANRSEHPVELVDVSTAGVAFLTDIALEVGEAVELGAQRAEVARVFPGGAAVSFL